jgi:hypothetical protein
MASNRIEELVVTLRQSENDHATATAGYALLNEVLAGYPVSDLLQLLHDGSARVVETVAWILSELGGDAAPYLGEIELLLSSSNQRVRFWALDAILAAASTKHPGTVANAIALVSDEDQAVRWQVAQLLAKMRVQDLGAAGPELGDPRLRSLLEWLVSGGGRRGDEVVARLGDVDPVARTFAVAAAVRIAEEDRAPLLRATKSSHEIVASTAQLAEKVLSLRKPTEA